MDIYHLYHCPFNIPTQHFLQLLTTVLIIFQVSILDINEDRGIKAVGQIKNKYKVSADRVQFIKCDVTDKNKFEGKRYIHLYSMEKPKAKA